MKSNRALDGQTSCSRYETYNLYFRTELYSQTEGFQNIFLLSMQSTSAQNY